MKAPILNYLSLLSTPSKNFRKFKQLYIFTGKGGVGKSCFSLAFAKYLTDQGHNTVYTSFGTGENKALCKELGVKYLDLTIATSAEEYLSRKLKSNTIAKWICKTAFFNALFNMLPALQQMILYGHIIDLVEKDKSLKLILDAPASGHAMSMFESPTNFKEIFGVGIILDDIKRMLDFTTDENLTEVNIISLPSEMALAEAKELDGNIRDKGILNLHITINNSLHEYFQSFENSEELPHFLQDKIEIEKDIIDENLHIVPHFASKNILETIMLLLQYFKAKAIDEV